MNDQEIVVCKEQMTDAYRALRIIRNEYIESEGLLDWEALIQILKSLPYIEDAYLEHSDDELEWNKQILMDEEYSYSRLVLKQTRGSKLDLNQDPELRKMIEEFKMNLYGLIGLISEDYGGSCQSNYQSSCPMSEWTDDYIMIYFMWYNHYGS